MSTKDIETREDITHLLTVFYEKALTDEVLKEKFVHLDMQTHIPVITNFWSSLVFYDQSYSGNPFVKHKEMNLQKVHFDRWIALFCQTMDELFAGPRAEEMKTRATSIASIFQHKLQIPS